MGDGDKTNQAFVPGVTSTGVRIPASRVITRTFLQNDDGDSLFVPESNRGWEGPSDGNVLPHQARALNDGTFPADNIGVNDTVPGSDVERGTGAGALDETEVILNNILRDPPGDPTESPEHPAAPSDPPPRLDDETPARGGNSKVSRRNINQDFKRDNELLGQIAKSVFKTIELDSNTGLHYSSLFDYKDWKALFPDDFWRAATDRAKQRPGTMEDYDCLMVAQDSVPVNLVVIMDSCQIVSDDEFKILKKEKYREKKKILENLFNRPGLWFMQTVNSAIIAWREIRDLIIIKKELIARAVDLREKLREDNDRGCVAIDSPVDSPKKLVEDRVQRIVKDIDEATNGQLMVGDVTEREVLIKARAFRLQPHIVTYIGDLFLSYRNDVLGKCLWSASDALITEDDIWNCIPRLREHIGEGASAVTSQDGDSESDSSESSDDDDHSRLGLFAGDHSGEHSSDGLHLPPFEAFDTLTGGTGDRRQQQGGGDDRSRQGERRDEHDRGHVSGGGGGQSPGGGDDPHRRGGGGGRPPPGGGGDPHRGGGGGDGPPRRNGGQSPDPRGRYRNDRGNGNYRNSASYQRNVGNGYPNRAGNVNGGDGGSLRRQKEEALTKLITDTLERVERLESNRGLEGLEPDLAAVKAVEENVKTAMNEYNRQSLAGECTFDTIRWGRDNFSIRELLCDKLEELTRWRQTIEDEQRDIRDQKIQETKQIMSDFNRVDFPKLTKRSNALQWLNQVQSILGDKKIPAGNQKITGNLKAALPAADREKVKNMLDANAVLKFVRERYAKSKTAIEVTMEPLLKYWVQPKTLRMMSNSIRIFHEKVNVLKKGGHIRGVEWGQVFRFENVIFTEAWKKEYDKELRIQESKKSANKPKTYVSPLDDSYEATMLRGKPGETKVWGNVTDQETAFERLDTLCEFSATALESIEERELEEATWGTGSKDREFVNHVNKMYEDKFAAAIEEECEQITEDDINSKIMVLNIDINGGAAAQRLNGKQGQVMRGRADNLVGQQQVLMALTDNKTADNKDGGVDDMMKPCIGGCGKLHKHGALWKCQEWFRKPLKERIEICKQLKICVKCLRKHFGKPHNCKPPECRECAENNPSSRFSHHWALCERKEAANNAKKLVESIEKVNVMMGKDDFDEISSGDEELNDDENDMVQEFINFVLPKCIEKEKENSDDDEGPFKQVIQDYEDSDYDIREQLRTLAEIVHEAARLRIESSNGGIKPNIVKEIVGDGKDKGVIERGIEVFKEAICILRSNEMVRAEDEKKIEKIEQMGISAVSAKELKNLLSKRMLKGVNKKHKNKKLYEKLRNRAMRLYRQCSTKFLKIVKIRMKLLPDEAVMDRENLIASGQMKVEEINGESYGVVSFLVDDGATVTALHSKLEKYIEHKTISYEVANIEGIGGELNERVKRASFALVKDNGGQERIPAIFLNNIVSGQKLNKWGKSVIMSELGISEKRSKDFIWPSEKKMEILGVLGRNCQRLHGSDVDPLDLDLKRPVCSPNLKVSFVEVAANHQLVVTGPVGVDPDEVDDNDQDCLNPTFLVSPDMEDMEDLPEHICWSIEKMKDNRQTADRLGLRLDEMIYCIKDLNKVPNKEECEAWKELRRDREKVNNERESQLFLINEDDNKEVMNAMMEVWNDDADENEVAGEECVICEKILLTVGETNALENFMKIEQEWKYMSPVCESHKAVIDKCKDCKLEGHEWRAEDKAIAQQYYDGLVLVEDEQHPGRKRIVQSYSFLKQNPKFGEFEHSMLDMALKSSKNMVKTAKMKGGDELKQVDGRFKKMERQGAVFPVNKVEMNEVIAGKRKAQWFCRGYVCKPSSMTTSVRVISDTARTAPGIMSTLAALMRCPKKSLNKLINSALLFNAHEHHVESDLEAAYYSVKNPEETQFLMLSIWFYDVCKHFDEFPVVLKSLAQEFGWGAAGLMLMLAIKKFPCSELDGYVKRLVENFSYVDNFPLTSPDGSKLSLMMIVDKVKKTFMKYNLNLDKIITAWETDTRLKEAGVSEHNCYGMKWLLETNEVQPLININEFKSVKGKYDGPDISKREVVPETLTRQKVARMTSQIYDITGRMLAIPIHSARVILSLVCEATNSKDMTEPIINTSPELANKAAEFFNSLKNYRDIKPIKRFCIPSGYRPLYAILDHDGAADGYGGVGYLACKKRKDNKSAGPDIIITIFAARSSVARAKVHDNETRSFPKVMEIGEQLCEAWADLLPDDFKFYITGDNIPSMYILTDTVQKSTVTRNAKLMVFNSLEKLSQKFPKMEFIFSWLDSSCHPSDLVSKLVRNPIAEAESDFWRQGSGFFLSEDILSMFTFMRYKDMNKTYFELPEKVKNGIGTIPELVASKFLTDNLTLGGAGGGPMETSDNIDDDKEADVVDRMIAIDDCVESDVIDRMMVIIGGDPSVDLLAEAECLTTEQSPVPVTPPNTPPPTPPESPKPPQPDPDPAPEPNPDPDPAPEPNPEPAPDRPLTPAAATMAVITRSKSRPATESVCYIDRWRRITGVSHDSTRPPLVNPETSRLTSFVITDKAWYKNLINRTENKAESTRRIASVLRCVRRMKGIKSDSDVDLLAEAECLWITSDQTLYPPDTRKVEIFKSDKNRIKFMKRNFGDKDQNIFTTKDPPYLHYRSPLAVKTLGWSHVEKNAIGFGRDCHSPYKSTRENIIQGAFPVAFAKMGKHASQYVRSCAWCCRTDLKYYRVPMGEVYTKLRATTKVMERVSFDPLGRIELKAWPGSKKKVTVYPILFKCIDTGVVDLELSESIDQRGIISAIRRMAFNIGTVPEVITHDAQPSLTLNNLSPMLKDGTRLFANTRFIKNVCRGQRRNYSESSSQIVKRIWQKFMRKSSEEKTNNLESMTILDMMILMRKTALVANSLPYSESSRFSPAHLRYTPNFITIDKLKFDDSATASEAFLHLEKCLKEYVKIAEDERRFVLIEAEERFRKKYHNDGTRFSKTDLTAAVGDVVIIKKEGIYENGELGLIEKLASDNTAMVITGRGLIKKQVSDLHPLVHMREMDDEREDDESKADEV